MSDARGRLHRLLLVWQTSVPVILLMRRGIYGVLPCSPDTVNANAHNTVDAQRHVGRALPCLSGMGVDGTHNTIGKMSAPTTLLGFCQAREVAGYCPAGVQGTVLGIAVNFECPALLSPSVSWSLPSGRPWSFGSQSALIALAGVVSRVQCIRSKKRVGVGSGV